MMNTELKAKKQYFKDKNICSLLSLTLDLLNVLTTHLCESFLYDNFNMNHYNVHLKQLNNNFDRTITANLVGI